MGMKHGTATAIFEIGVPSVHSQIIYHTLSCIWLSRWDLFSKNRCLLWYSVAKINSSTLRNAASSSFSPSPTRPDGYWYIPGNESELTIRFARSVQPQQVNTTPGHNFQLDGRIEHAVEWNIADDCVTLPVLGTIDRWPDHSKRQSDRFMANCICARKAVVP